MKEAEQMSAAEMEKGSENPNKKQKTKSQSPDSDNRLTNGKRSLSQ
jgi:hypothetical protein